MDVVSQVQVDVIMPVAQHRVLMSAESAVETILPVQIVMVI